ncbi:MAG: DUF1854 domain-containing protein [Thermoguttaceae bacterium]
MPETTKNADFSLKRDAWGQIVLTYADGRQVVGVEPARAFPISSPDGMLSICDAEGRELVCVEEVAALQPELRRVLEEELARREFVPVVVRIEEVDAEADPSRWRVQTDRGPTEFFMEDSDNGVRRLGPTRILLVDSHGIRYLIPNTRQLDTASRRILDRYL